MKLQIFLRGYDGAVVSKDYYNLERSKNYQQQLAGPNLLWHCQHEHPFTIYYLKRMAEKENKDRKFSYRNCLLWRSRTTMGTCISAWCTLQVNTGMHAGFIACTHAFGVDDRFPSTLSQWAWFVLKPTNLAALVLYTVLLICASLLWETSVSKVRFLSLLRLHCYTLYDYPTKITSQSLWRLLAKFNFYYSSFRKKFMVKITGRIVATASCLLVCVPLCTGDCNTLIIP